MFACFVTALLAGLVTVRTGCCVSRITVRTESVECPAASVATMCSAFWPSVASRALRLNAFPVMLAAWPFTATLVAVWSCTLPATVTSVSRVIRPGDGLVIVIAGCVVSVAANRTSRKPLLLPCARANTWKVFWAWSATGTATLPTWLSKVATVCPFTTIDPSAMRLVPFALPFTRWT